MKFCAVLAVLLLAILAVADAQYRRRIRVRYPAVPLPNQGDQFAASLGGAQVGTYGKSRNYGNNGRGGYFSGSEVHGGSLANAKVGLYGNDRTKNNWAGY